MSDTPRTDNSVLDTDWLGTRVELVNADFARKLERENAALRAELEAQAIVNGKGGEREAKLLAEVAALRKDKERLDWMASADYWADIAVYRTPKGLRAAIDAARKEAKP